MAFTQMQGAVVRREPDTVNSASPEEALAPEQKTLRRSEARLRAIIEGTPDAIGTLDAEGRLLSLNASGMAAMGIDDFARFQGTPWQELWQAEYREAAQHALQTASGGQNAAFQGWSQGIAANVAPHWWAVIVAPLPEYSEHSEYTEAPYAPERFLCVCRDLTEHKHLADRWVHEAERDHRIAETLQRCLLPTSFEEIGPAFAIQALSRPAFADEASVGGDFYDAYLLPGGKTALVVGDVMGKGLAAAISIAEVRFALRGFLYEDASPAGALQRLNHFLIASQRLEKRPRNVLVSLSLAILDTETGDGAGTIALAGAEAALVRRAATGAVHSIQGKGNLLLGVNPGEEYAAEPFRLAPGDVLLLMTDGVTDARSGKDFFGIEGAAATLATSGSMLEAADAADPDAALSRCTQDIADAAAAFADRRTLRDDVCLLLARRKSESHGSHSERDADEDSGRSR